MNSRLMGEHGISLIELMVVISIISILLVIAGIAGKQWIDQYNAESQIRTMHTDLMQARVRAMEKNRQYFVAVKADGYQVVEDANENGVADASDSWQSPNTLNYQVSAGIGTITIDQRGIVSAGTNTQDVLMVIEFDTGSATPEYNCMQLYATRINIGRMNGADCVP